MKPAITLICALLFATNVIAGTTIQKSTNSKSDKQVIEQLLHNFLANSVQDDFKNHQRFWADELVYTSSNGTRFNKAFILKDLKPSQNNHNKNKDSQAPAYTAQEIDIRIYNNTAILAFKLVAEYKGNKEQDQTYYNTGTLLKRKGQWQVIAWQATKIPKNKNN